MKFKVTLRNKLTAEIETQIIEADNESDACCEADETPHCQILSIRPVRVIGEKIKKDSTGVYVSTRALRARQERDLCNKQMHLGKYAIQS